VAFEEGKSIYGIERIIDGTTFKPSTFLRRRRRTTVAKKAKKSSKKKGK
jgi:hypothetical protein